VTGGAREMAVAPSGKEVAFVARGDVFVTSVEGGVTKRITATPEDERSVGFAPDGKALVYASERGGRWAVYEARRVRDAEPHFHASTIVKETPLVANAQQNTQPLYSPDGKEVAFLENRNTLKVLNLESKQARTILTDKEIFSGGSLHCLARFEKNANLWSTNLRTKETKMLVALNAASGSLAWDKEQKSIFLLADGSLSKIDPAGAKRESIGIKGEAVADLQAERAAMFDHVWRRTRDTFYSAGYHGIDWQAIRPVYAKHLPHIGNNHEFAEMLSEMLGELNISHSGSSFSASSPTDDSTWWPTGTRRPTS